jgi:gliding motility-associated-like protein
MIQKNFLFFLFFCTYINLFSQEICDNGIDDDADGLVDLNDKDCDCSAYDWSNIPSLIPNSDFENYIVCPSMGGQMNRSTGWKQGGRNSDPDYFNTCGYAGQNPSYFTPPTKGNYSGNGYVGFYNYSNIVEDYKEYIATCLTTPLQIGVTYKIKIQIGFITSTLGTFGSDPSLEFAIFGTNSCAMIPYNSRSCPMTSSGSFQLLAVKIVSGADEWVQAEITFTPTVATSVLIFGPSCRPVPMDNNPYYFMDGIVLNKKDVFERNKLKKKIISVGEYCKNSIYLQASFNSGATIQWFKDGIALIGKTAVSLAVDTSQKGIYEAIITENEACFKTNKISMELLFDSCLDKVEPSFFMPNSFTPNMDNKNETFLPVFFNEDMNFTHYSFQIFNRWGSLIYENNENNLTGWAARADEIPIQQGIYIWKLKFKVDGEYNVIQKYGHVGVYY